MKTIISWHFWNKFLCSLFGCHFC